MKKLTIAILALLYIITTSGVVVNMHYCMGAVASVGYGYDIHDVCGKCGMTEKEGCCHTEYKVVKVEDEHQQAYSGLPSFHSDAEVPVQFHDLTFERVYTPEANAFHYHSPPDKRANAVFLHNCVFRI